MLGIPRENIQESIAELTDCHTQLRHVQEELKRLKASVKAAIIAKVITKESIPEGAD
jgi:hypothetical protein